MPAASGQDVREECACAKRNKNAHDNMAGSRKRSCRYDIGMIIAFGDADSLERYRSGHNEAVLKTVCPQGHVGSNPTLSVFGVPARSAADAPGVGVPKAMSGLPRAFDFFRQIV